MDSKTLKGSLLLLLTALIWGVAFVAQSVGMEYVGPFTFNCVRSLIGAAFLVPCIRLMDHWRRTGLFGGAAASRTEGSSAGEETVSAGNTSFGKGRSGRALWIGGACCGTALFVASNLQQAGIQYTTVGKAGFITALYIVLVPVLGLLFGNKAGRKVLAGVVLAVFGLYMLCMQGETASFGKGEFLELLCAAAFSVQILLVSRYSPLVDGLRLSCVQFLVSGLESAVLMFLLEEPHIGAILQGWIPILYAGVLSCGVAYTLQIIAQKDLNPTVASLIMSMESVFSVLAGWLILGQKLSFKEICGCALMFAAILLAQLPDRKQTGMTEKKSAFVE